MKGKSSDLQSTKLQQQQRQLKQKSFNVLVIAFVTLVAANIFLGGPAIECLIPISALVGLFTVALGAELYLISPKRFVRDELIDQELEWLFGKDKVKSVTPLEFVFAQERIRRRRANRWRFVLLSIPFLVLIAFLLFPTITFWYGGEPVAALVLLSVELLILVVLVVLFVGAFSVRAMLAHQERRALANIALEIHAQFGAIMKPNAWYRLSYDGELIEVSEAEALEGKAPSFIAEEKASPGNADELA